MEFHKREVNKRPMSMLDVKGQLQSIEDSTRWKQRYTLADMYIWLARGTIATLSLSLLVSLLIG